MPVIILWSLAGGFAGGAVGFGIGWHTGRRRLRKLQKEKSAADGFLKLLMH